MPSCRLTLPLDTLPKATLTVEPKWSPLYTGETVTLKCVVDSHSNWKYVWYINQSHTATSSTSEYDVTITAAAGSDEGQYWCEGRLEGRNVTSQRSDPITLTVEALPKTTLTVEPKENPLYAGETVTLKCEVDSHSNWTYVWYKDQHQTAMSQTAGDRYSIAAAAGSDQGQYWCEGQRESRPRSSQRSDPITLTVKDRLVFGLGAAPLLLASIILCVKCYRNREGTLSGAAAMGIHCGFGEWGRGHCLAWEARHSDLKRSHSHMETMTSPHRASIRPAAQELSSAETGRQLKDISQSHKGLHLTNQQLLIKRRRRQLRGKLVPPFGGSIEGHRDWERSLTTQAGREEVSDLLLCYSSLQLVPQLYPVSAISPTVDRSPQQQSAVCRHRSGSSYSGERHRAHKQKYIFNVVKQFCSARRTQPVLTLDPDWPQIFTGERITLRCQSQEDTSKGFFFWFKHEPQRQEVHRSLGDSYTIPSAAVEDSGSYECCVHETQFICSAAVRLTVSVKPWPVLTVSPPGQIYVGESVSLSCRVTVPSAGWEYYWYKDVRYYGSHYKPFLSSGVRGSYTLSPAALTHSGQYRCRAGRGNPVWYTEYSESVPIQVSALPKATLTVEPKWSPLYTGETVTLKCEVDSHSNWKYIWYKGQLQTAVTQTAGHSLSGDRYSITAAAGSNQGQYWCEGQRESRPRSSQRSDPITLTVKEKPRPVLSVSPQGRIYEGESVRLSCRVTVTPAGWEYYWYKDVQYYGSHYKPFLSSGVRGSYTLSPAALTHSGEYRCRAGRGTSVWYTEYSEPVHIQVSALPKATLTVEPKWSPLYTGETVTLKCEVDSHSNWKYVWYKGRSSTALVSGDRYSITAAAWSDQGQYWCEGQRESRPRSFQRSAPVTLTVEALPKANLTVEPKWSPLYAGETVTLKCEVDSHSNWTYVWYKDQLQTAVSQTAGHSVSGDRYSITAAAGSDQGQYWCEGRLEGRNRTSQRSDPITLNVKDRSIITLAIALGVVAALIVSVLILIFFMKWRRTRGSPCLACLHSE
ncbi:hypothetical protein JZ751_022067 [Albula glossodonta]|uniref:Ig-like domain-containing protein n=1 Tax=Albula glossodonta TaxID=121402 RepID=A0A8T2MXL8_9TELE|nr:hypothetical protein JZ751_022067 [Albula glossodonta]